MTTTVSPASSSSATTGPSGRSIATSAQPAWARWRVSSANPVSVCGTAIDRFTVPHTDTGLAELTRHLGAAGLGEVAIERPVRPVVAELLEAGLTVVVISPNQLKNLRSRYGSAGNKDDRFDAYVLADTLRTDRARLRPLVPDSPATVTLRGTCRARKDLVGHRVALANQLRAHLQTALPAAVGLFADLDSPISLRFLHRFDTQDKLDWLSPKRLAAWLASVGYCGRVDPAVLHARLTAAPRGLTGSDGATQAHLTRALLAVLTSMVAQIKALAEQVGEQLDAHADAHIFTSLPRSGTVRAARLLAEIGDCRARFPTPESLACLAGVAPSTRQSGKSGGLPLGGRQTTARRGLRLRRRQPAREPLGGQALPRRRQPGPRPPARRPHPGPSLALRDLALLAGRHRLPAQPPPRPATPAGGLGRGGGGLNASSTPP